ncbi:MAG: hypothetical protein QMD23_02435 [Candidatus Bathyarchaeia archaeon]|nr:hypothetical protein [Candidatus Bathyarchaeia archaeon]
MLAEIDAKIRKAKKAFKQLGYIAEDVSAKEFHDYMTGEMFSEDKTTLRDVLDSEFLAIHELVEISELKKMGRTINKRVIVGSPKTMIYEAYFTAMELELNYALLKKDYPWIRTRLERHKTSVLEDDPHLPEELRPRGKAILERFKKMITEST